MMEDTTPLKEQDAGGGTGVQADIQTSSFLRPLCQALVLVLVVLAVAFFVPFDVRAPRNSYQSAAMAWVKNFSSAAVEYSAQNPSGSCYWDDGTTDFGEYFAFTPVRTGYIFSYYAADAQGRPARGGNAVKFVFLAWPVTTRQGRRAYYADETNCLWEARFDWSSEFDKFDDWVPPNASGINWSASPDQSRLAASGIEFERK